MIEVLKQALEALDDRASLMKWQAARKVLHQAIAEAEKLTTTRNAWTGKATYKCNLCGREDFRSEHSAKFHTCQALEEQEQPKQDRWMDIHLPDTSTKVEQEPVAITENMAFAFHNAITDGALGTDDLMDIMRGLEAAFANTFPPQRQPLTDKQIEKLLDAVISENKTKNHIWPAFARAIEAAHGIKGEA
jgi:hypothetical protein